MEEGKRGPRMKREKTEGQNGQGQDVTCILGANSLPDSWRHPATEN
jgi:hypothetical protein